MNPKRIATVFIGAEIGLAALFGIEGATGHMTGIAYATVSPAVQTINLSEIYNPNMFEVCIQEDCSDQPNQVGMWLDEDAGNWYLELGEVCTGAIPAECSSETYLVVDDTVAP